MQQKKSSRQCIKCQKLTCYTGTQHVISTILNVANMYLQFKIRHVSQCQYDYIMCLGLKNHISCYTAVTFVRTTWTRTTADWPLVIATILSQTAIFGNNNAGIGWNAITSWNILMYFHEVYTVQSFLDIKKMVTSNCFENLVDIYITTNWSGSNTMAVSCMLQLTYRLNYVDHQTVLTNSQLYYFVSFNMAMVC